MPSVGRIAAALSILGIALLARPAWREYSIELFTAVGSLGVAKSCAGLYRRRLPASRASAFRSACLSRGLPRRSVGSLERAEEVAAAIGGAQTRTAVVASMRASAERRLITRHGVALEEHDRARGILGDELFELLRVPIDETAASQLELRTEDLVRHLDRLDAL